MLAAYGLNSVIHPGTLIYTILDVMSQTGSAVFNNLALLFAMGVAIGTVSYTHLSEVSEPCERVPPLK